MQRDGSTFPEEATDSADGYLSDDTEELSSAEPDAPTGKSRKRRMVALSEKDKEVRRRGHARVWGSARSVQMRQESLGPAMQRQVLVFRIEIYDDAGNRLPPVPVEMRSISVRGQVSEGEQVTAVGTFHRGTLIADKITNAVTGARVGPPPLTKWSLRLAVVALVTVVAFLIAGAWTFYQHMQQEIDIFERQFESFQVDELLGFRGDLR